MMTESQLVSLGRTEINISPLGLGTWQWGDRMLWQYGGQYTETDILAAFQATMEAGINFFDTAEMYGMGSSERLLGKCLADLRSAGRGQDLVTATKFFPFPYRLGKKAFLQALKGSLERLRLEKVDLYQMHFPFPPVPIEAWMVSMVEAVQKGLVRAVGVSNYNVEQMQRAFKALQVRGIPLASNQVDYSLLNRQPEHSGLLSVCRELGITLIAYSPLRKGLLTGKYTPDHLPPGIRRIRQNRACVGKIQPLIRFLREIGERHGGKSPAQVSLNWIICKGAIAIPGAKNARQAKENAGALDWRLTEEEVLELDRMSNQIGA